MPVVQGTIPESLELPIGIREVYLENNNLNGERG